MPIRYCLLCCRQSKTADCLFDRNCRQHRHIVRGFNPAAGTPFPKNGHTPGKGICRIGQCQALIYGRHQFHPTGLQPHPGALGLDHIPGQGVHIIGSGKTGDLRFMITRGKGGFTGPAVQGIPGSADKRALAIHHADMVIQKDTRGVVFDCYPMSQGLPPGLNQVVANPGFQAMCFFRAETILDMGAKQYRLQGGHMDAGMAAEAASAGTVRHRGFADHGH